MQLIQLVHTLNYGDAISGEAIAISRLLHEQGIENSIFCLHAHEKVRELCRPWSEFAEFVANAHQQGARPALVLHYSIGSPQNDAFRHYQYGPTALIYHNLTPDRWFTGYNARVVHDLRHGRDELPALLEKSDIVLADSDFNRQELRQFGCDRSTVLPLLLDLEKWSVAANGGIAQALRGHGGVNILHVGRTAPNKCIEDILKSFYFFHHKIHRQSRLWLVGGDVDTEIYSFELRRLVSELRLKEAVNFVGSVSDGELRAFYENSQAYICMSEHEGFCVPLLEAMHFGLPVLAYASTAIPETLGDAGVLVDAKEHGLLAEMLNLLCFDETHRSALVARGHARAKGFTTEHFLKKLEAVLLQPLKTQRVSGGALLQSARNA